MLQQTEIVGEINNTEINQEISNEADQRQDHRNGEEEVTKARNTEQRPTTSKKGKQKVTRKKWTWDKKFKLSNDFPDFDLDLNYPKEDFDPVPMDYFKDYYDDDFFETVATQTNIHYHQVNGKILNTNATEIRRLIGVTLLMSTLKYPRINKYWSTHFRVSLIADNITIDRYFLLRNTVHLVDNNSLSEQQKSEDRLWKVRPLIDKFRNAVLKLPREKNVCIDEQIIPFAGHAGIRQYVPRKPNPTGLKVYVLAAASGIILDFIIYQGANTNFPQDVNNKLGVGGRAVLKLTETCLPGTNVYFDRYFTGAILLEQLHEKGISATGTIMSNRFPNIGLKSDAELKNMGRGSIDCKTREDGKITIVKWMDNRGVIMASTIHSEVPHDNARRYSKVDKAYINIQRPDIVRQYNTNMGGVDLVNRMIAAYRSYHRTKKWPVRTLEHFMDMAVVNSWLKYKTDCKHHNVNSKKILDLHDFKIQVAQELILTSQKRKRSLIENEEHVPRKKCRGRPGLVPIPPQVVRSNQANHLPQAEDLSTAQRCRKEGCKGRSRIKCIKCDIFLCILKERNCFRDFHLLR